MSVALFSLLMLVLTPFIANARPTESLDSRDPREILMMVPQRSNSWVQPNSNDYAGFRQTNYGYNPFRPAVGQPPNEVESRIGFALLLLLLNGLDDRYASTQQPMPNPPMANFSFPVWPPLNRPRYQ
ncbi:hypothetical protein DAPPUDRAFT_322308 [Daphnia pulex]|uniref:Uncharacterized protein n=1 Tax=Daphnia pulex TaxID=6669 RepID=E9GVJ1_DAPPU|nr:hypothetical protein DAPPUDRAFT_322308 [Daphnia pulex]|eukprot:EFX76521.1 hypothetical protein DAPPUDRAFT_322308 [Daphnia pulex]